MTDPMRVNGVRTTKSGEKVRLLAIEVPLDIYTEIERRALAEDRPISRQALHYLRAAVSSHD